MTRVIARIIIDTDDWEDDSDAGETQPMVVWRKVETSRAHPFTARELGQSTGSFGELYFS
jgi:hypothetical protein